MLENPFRFERDGKKQGASRIGGLDEAGRGPLAGPVAAAVCVFLEEVRFAGLNDSKQLSEVERERLFKEITVHPSIEWAIGLASAAEIDQFNIVRATFLAMNRALAQLATKPDLLLIDGHLAPSFGIPIVPIVKGDAQSASIAAASILAKVTRDRLMTELGAEFPQYGFKEHKGYGTPQHLTALRQWGPSNVHRKTFAPVSPKSQETLDLPLHFY
ncbi:MAG TPA: ribonuclease HII [Chlamydiales bacterium]|jgi:ribonuclease HII